MDSLDITTGLSECIGGGALTISTETKIALQSSLVIKMHEEKFKSIKLWGKIIGVKQDYYIAQGFGENEVTDRKSFYSVMETGDQRDGVTWAELKKVHPVLAATARKITKRFTGNPGDEEPVTEPGPDPQSPPLDLPQELKEMRKTESSDGSSYVTTQVKEADRLATMIAQIDFDCACVPHGAYIKEADNKIVKKRSFEGLDLANASLLQMYEHFRVPVIKRTALERAQQDKTLYFFDPIAADIPNGSWSLQQERGGAVVVLKSLVWPGFTFWHAPGTQKYGYVYNGLAQRNLDLAFMLPEA